MFGKQLPIPPPPSARSGRRQAPPLPAKRPSNRKEKPMRKALSKTSFGSTATLQKVLGGNGEVAPGASPFEEFFHVDEEATVEPPVRSRSGSQDYPSRKLGKYAMASHRSFNKTMERPTSFRRNESSDDDDWENSDSENDDIAVPYQDNDRDNQEAVVEETFETSLASRKSSRHSSSDEEDWSAGDDSDDEQRVPVRKVAPVVPTKSSRQSSRQSDSDDKTGASVIKVSPKLPAKRTAPAVPAKRVAPVPPVKNSTSDISVKIPIKKSAPAIPGIPGIPAKRATPAVPAKSSRQSSSEDEEWSDGGDNDDEIPASVRKTPVRKVAPPIPDKSALPRVSSKKNATDNLAKRVAPELPAEKRGGNVREPKVAVVGNGNKMMSEMQMRREKMAARKLKREKDEAERAVKAAAENAERVAAALERKQAADRRRKAAAQRRKEEEEAKKIAAIEREVEMKKRNEIIEEAKKKAEQDKREEAAKKALAAKTKREQQANFLSKKTSSKTVLVSKKSSLSSIKDVQNDNKSDRPKSYGFSKPPIKRVPSWKAKAKAAKAARKAGAKIADASSVPVPEWRSKLKKTPKPVTAKPTVSKSGPTIVNHHQNAASYNQDDEDDDNWDCDDDDGSSSITFVKKVTKVSHAQRMAAMRSVTHENTWKPTPSQKQASLNKLERPRIPIKKPTVISKVTKPMVKPTRKPVVVKKNTPTSKPIKTQPIAAAAAVPTPAVVMKEEEAVEGGAFRLSDILKELGGAYIGYESALIDDGFDTLEELKHVEVDDLLECGMKKGHAKRLIKFVAAIDK
jgi:hypothetical protein